MRLLALRAVSICSLLMLTTAAPVVAQECLGYTAERGQVSLNPEVILADQATTLGAVVNAYWPGPLGFEARIGRTSYDSDLFDSNGWDFSGRLGYEFGIPGVSVCPFTGLAYSRVARLGTLSGIVIPLGVGVGGTLPTGSRYIFTVSGAPQLLYFHQTFQREGLESESEGDVELGLSVAATLGTDRLYGRLSLALSLVGERYNGVGISLGIPLGG